MEVAISVIDSSLKLNLTGIKSQSHGRANRSIVRLIEVRFHRSQQPIYLMAAMAKVNWTPNGLPNLESELEKNENADHQKGTRCLSQRPVGFPAFVG